MMNLEKRLKWMRDRGWMVGCHNDYWYQGKIYTFWLFTQGLGSGKFVNGESKRGDSDAVSICIDIVKELEKKDG